MYDDEEKIFLLSYDISYTTPVFEFDWYESDNRSSRKDFQALLIKKVN